MARIITKSAFVLRFEWNWLQQKSNNTFLRFFLLWPPLSSLGQCMYMCRRLQNCFSSLERVKVQFVTKITDKERKAVENGHHHKIGQTPIVLHANQSHKQSGFILFMAICLCWDWKSGNWNKTFSIQGHRDALRVQFALVTWLYLGFIWTHYQIDLL